MSIMMQIPGRGLFGAPRLAFENLPSTNQWALDHGGAMPHGTLIVVDNQVSGHGRLNRPWLFAPGKSIAMSIILRRDSLPVPFPNAGQLAALAVGSMLVRYGVRAAFKWPNDVMVLDRKIAGILAEQDPGGETMVLGLGFNVNLSEADLAEAGLSQIATSLSIACGAQQPLDTIDQELVTCLQDTFKRAETDGLPGLLAEWRLHDWLAHTTITVTLPSTSISGAYNGIDADGALLLDIPGDGTRHILAGDIINVRPQRKNNHG